MYLDPKNIPKTPSEEVFGRLGKSIVKTIASLSLRFQTPKREELFGPQKRTDQTP